MANGQEAGGLHVCPTRSSSSTRIGCHFRGRTLSLRALFRRAFRIHFAPFPRRIVIRVGCFLRRPQCLRHMAQVDANASPRGRSASHRIHQHIVDGEKRGSVRIFVFPSFETRQRGLFIGRVRHQSEAASSIAGLSSPLRTWHAKASPAPLPPPSCESAAATAHRQVPLLHLCPRVPAVVPSDPAAPSMSACGSPISSNRFGTVRIVKSDGSQSGTSCQCSGVDTRASGSGRTE